MPRKSKQDADDAQLRFYGALIDMGDDDGFVPDDAQIMISVGDVRAICRDRNVLQGLYNEGGWRW